MRSPGDRRRRLALILTLTTAGAGPVSGALAQDTAPAERPPVKAYTVLIAKTTAPRQAVQAKQGSYCLPAADGSGGTCHVARFPLPDLPAVTVSGGTQVTLLFKASVGYVTWRTARVNGNGQEVVVATGEGEQVTRTKKRWRVKLPARMRRSVTVLGFFVQYANAYNSFEIGLKVR